MCEDQNGYLYAGVYAHTIRSNPVIYKSIDGGLQWSIITNFLEINTSARHIHCITYDKNNDCLYCLVGEINTLYKSHDGGFHWIDTKLQTGGLFHQKCTAVIPTEHFRILGSDGPYNFEIYLTSDNTHYKTTYQGWAGVIFGFRQSDKTDNLYAFTKLDISVEDSNYWPPVNCNKPFSWLRNNLLDRKDWLIYNLSCKSRFPKDAIRPQHAAILGSNDEGKSWKILYIEQVGTDSNYGFWTAGTFFNGKCSFSLVTRNKNGEKAFTKTIIIDENN